MKILIVEDDNVQANMIEESLKRDFGQVEIENIRTESEFREKFKFFANASFDIIILDVMLKWATLSRNMKEPPAEIKEEGFYRGGMRCLKLLLESPDMRTKSVIVYSMLGRDDLIEEFGRLPHNILFLEKDSDDRRLIRYVRSLMQGVPVGGEGFEIVSPVSAGERQSLDALVDSVDKAASSDEKGRSLEELASRLFETIDGFSVSRRIRTATEEIDLSILNDSDDARLRREQSLIIAECKNWSAKCGKDEFVIFRGKLENRNGRCTLGFLISWNGFTDTVTKEMLRGSHEDILIVPIIGKDIRKAVKNNNFHEVLIDCWNAAVNL